MMEVDQAAQVTDGSKIKTINGGQQSDTSDNLTQPIFLFMRVKSLSLLWEKQPEAMKSARIILQKCVVHALQKFNGFLMHTDERIFLCSFCCATDSIECCLYIQMYLVEVDWPHELLNEEPCKVVQEDGVIIFRGLRLCMGVHMGEIGCLRNSKLAVHVAISVADLAMGGQILLAGLITKELYTYFEAFKQKYNIIISELGLFKIKGIHESLTITQILPGCLPRFKYMKLLPSHAPLFSDNTVSLDTDESATTVVSMEKDSEKILQFATSRDSNRDTIPWLRSSSEFKLGRNIGSGTTGEIFTALWKDKTVAVKRYFRHDFSDDVLKNMKVELSFMVGLKHPYIVEFIAAVAEPSRYWIITEYFPKGSLAAVLKDTSLKRISLQLRLKWMYQISSAMSYLHNYNPPIMHRDLKSDNVLVALNMTVKVTDFGFARVVSNKFANTQCGTIAWCAPEILEGKAYALSIDVYSFAFVVYEIFMRVKPYFDEDFNNNLLLEIIHGKRPSLSNKIPPAIVSLITECWDGIPSNRPKFDDIMKLLTYINPETGKLSSTALSYDWMEVVEQRKSNICILI